MNGSRSEPKAHISLTLNGKPAEADVPARKTLLDAVREELGQTGTHAGCEHGVCGCCNVLLDGKVVRSCLLLAVQADGRDVRTVESLGSPERLGPLQRAFAEKHAMQCGYCTPGMIMAAADLLAANPDPDESEIRTALSGNLCRCTGYMEIVDAVKDAAGRIARGETVVEEPPALPADNAGGPYIGRRIPPVEDRRFVAGKGAYINDFTLPDLLHMATVRSPHAHARIVSIDTSRAEALPGVAAVILGAMLPDVIDPVPQNLDIPNVLWYPLAVDKVRYAGEWVAAVVAENRYVAEDAAELVEVEYEMLAPVVDPRGGHPAGRPGAAREARQQRRLRAGADLRPGGRGRRQGAACVRGTLPLEPPLRRAAGDLRSGGEVGRRPAGDEPVGFPPDPQHRGAARQGAAVAVEPAPRPPAPGRGRQPRGQARPQAHVPHRGGEPDAGPPGEVHRGPAGEHELRRRPRTRSSVLPARRLRQRRPHPGPGHPLHRRRRRLRRPRRHAAHQAHHRHRGPVPHPRGCATTPSRR